jgi:hypothetical protein
MQDKRMPALARPGIVAGVVACLVLTTVAVGLWVMFRPVSLRQVKSPTGEVTATIAAQRGWVQPWEISVTVARKDGSAITKRFHSVDMWSDIDDRSFPMKWLANDRLQIGDREGSFDGGWEAVIEWPQLEIRER